MRVSGGSPHALRFLPGERPCRHLLVQGGSRQLCKGGPCEARGEGRRCLAIRLGFHGRGHRGSRGDDCERFPHYEQGTPLLRKRSSRRHGLKLRLFLSRVWVVL